MYPGSLAPVSHVLHRPVTTPLIFGAAALLLTGCPARPEGIGQRDVVVYWTVTSLGTRVASELDWCQDLRDMAATAGTSVACLKGAIPPSQSTTESHLRALDPMASVGSARAELAPSGDEILVTRWIAGERDLAHVVALDSPSLASASWGSADELFLASNPDGQRPVDAGIDAILEHTARGDGVAALLNEAEAGGNRPRCWFDPDAPACAALWDFGVEHGAIDPAGDPADVWLHPDTWDAVEAVIGQVDAGTRDAIRPAYWGTVVHSAEWYTVTSFQVRLARLLDGLAEQGRLEDLVLVITGDHGQSPCFVDPLTGVVDCEHGDANDFSARVPAYVFPAVVGEVWAERDYVGSVRVPWSTVNLAYGLVQATHVDTPDDWPRMERAGAATTWSCDGDARGLRVVGDVSLRCAGAACGVWEWGDPDDLAWTPTPWGEVPDSLVPYGETADGGATWFERACRL